MHRRHSGRSGLQHHPDRGPEFDPALFGRQDQCESGDPGQSRSGQHATCLGSRQAQGTVCHCAGPEGRQGTGGLEANESVADRKRGPARDRRVPRGLRCRRSLRVLHRPRSHAVEELRERVPAALQDWRLCGHPVEPQRQQDGQGRRRRPARHHGQLSRPAGGGADEAHRARRRPARSTTSLRP